MWLKKNRLCYHVGRVKVGLCVQLVFRSTCRALTRACPNTELEGRKELVDTGKSSRTWSVPTVSLRLAVLNVFQGFLGPKMAVFGPKLQFLKLRSATCESRSRPPPLSFLLKLCVIVVHTHRYHPPKFHLNLKHHDGDLIFPHFARAACCLLAACCCCC